VKVTYPREKTLGDISGQELTTPDLEPRTWKVGIGYINDLLGWESEPERQKEAFLRMGLGVDIVDNNNIKVHVPAYRWDILHKVDLVEEAAIGMGYLNSPERLPGSMTFGSRREIQERAESAREIMVGLGFQEVMTLSLSGAKAQFERMGRDPGDIEPGVTRMANPIGREYSLLRTSLVPGLIEVLAANTHRELPQRLFEVGEVVIDHQNRQRVAFVELEPRANFSRAKGLVQALQGKLGHDIQLESAKQPGFIPGRCARVMTDNERRLGHFGEMAPGTIVAWDLAHPLIAGEFEL